MREPNGKTHTHTHVTFYIAGTTMTDTVIKTTCTRGKKARVTTAYCATGYLKRPRNDLHTQKCTDKTDQMAFILKTA